MMTPHQKLDDACYVPLWKLFEPFAKAAIEAMRDPSPGMLEVVHGDRDAVDTYKDFIDAALKEE
jgi:hypothetical protein